MTIERLAPVECRLEGRTLAGVALRYGEQATDRPEMFAAGAFQPLGVVSLNLQHDSFREIASTDGGSLRINDGPADLRIEAELRRDSAELSLVRRRALRGLSVEFRTLTERRDPSGVRIIERAELPAIGLVDQGSYRTQVEIRQAMAEAWLTATIHYGASVECTCQGGGCDSVSFEPGAFDETLDSGDVTAIGGSGFNSVLGSTRRGTLILESDEEAFRIGLIGPTDSAAARATVENARAGPIFARPMVEPDVSDFVDEGAVRRFTRASFRGILIKATPNSRGHQPATVRGVPETETDAPEPNSKRRRLWL